MRATLFVLSALALAGCDLGRTPPTLQTCARFAHPIVVDGAHQRGVGTQCLDDNGSWALRGSGESG